MTIIFQNFRHLFLKLFCAEPAIELLNHGFTTYSYVSEIHCTV